MKRLGLLSLLLMSFTACSHDGGADSAGEGTASGVVYGEDSRRDPNPNLKKEPLVIRNALQASATLMRMGHVHPGKKGSVIIRGKDIKRERNLCPEVRFVDQPEAAYCSAVLIEPNKILTAGHCVEMGCDDLRIIFGWTKYTAKFLSRSDVYECKTISEMKLSFENADEPDLAIIELDRKVVDRQPVEISKEPLRKDEDVFIIGYPWGMPQKISTAKVRQETGVNYVKVNSDTFTGDSGGPVFSTDGKLKGLLIGGEVDYVGDQKRGCNMIKRCKDDECRGEDVLRLNDATLKPAAPAQDDGSDDE